MDFLKELTDLIAVRQYVAETRGSFDVERSAINDLNSILVFLDKKIIDMIRSSDFKSYIRFQGKVEEVPVVRSGLKK